jgi:hypothetical protein
MRTEEGHRHIEHPAPFERKDISPKGIILFIAGLFVTILIVMAGLSWLLGLWSLERRTVGPQPRAARDQVPAPPQLQETPPIDMKTLRAQEDAILHTYGWADEGGGVVRIPIETAIDILAQRGLPSRSERGIETAPATGAPSGAPRTGPPVPRQLLQPGIRPPAGKAQEGAPPAPREQK